MESAGISSVDDVRAAVARARAAQVPWRQLSVRARARALAPFERLLVRHADELALLEVEEQGKTLFEAYGVMLNLIRYLRYLRRKAPRALGSRRAWPFFGLTRAHRIFYEPHGVVGVISPWNYPFTLSLEPLLAAVIAGNGVVLKPSEHTPLVGLRIASLFREAGLPEDLVGVVHGDGAVGAALVDADIDKLVFTGSVASGRRVAEAAGRRIIPVTLELGGKDAAIVLADAHLERAAAGVTWGALLNAGQACLAIERVYVEEAIADRFVELLVHEVEKLRVGPGSSADVEVGAITTVAQLGIIESHIEDAVKKGAKVLCGGERVPGDGLFYQPTVVTGVDADMKILTEETFGPVVVVVRVPDPAHAVQQVNGSGWGLTCSIWTRDQSRGRSLARQIDVGDVAINEHGMPAGHAEIPWGGVKESGYGRTRGVEGLREMTVTKHVSWARLQSRREPYWFPYSAKKVAILRALIRFLYGTWRERLGVLTRRSTTEHPTKGSERETE